MATMTTRPLDDTDRKFLEEISAFPLFGPPQIPWKNRLLLIAISIGVALLIGAQIGGIAFLIYLLFSGLTALWIWLCVWFNLAPEGAAWDATTITLVGTMLIWALPIAYLTMICVSLSRVGMDIWRTKRLVAKELAHNEVTQTHAIIKDVKAFTEPEHGDRLYYWLLDDGRIRIELEAPKAEELTMTHYTLIDDYRYAFSGPKIKKPRAKRMTSGYDQEPETWCRIAWEDLEAHLMS